jgi:hypothetical protein
VNGVSYGFIIQQVSFQGKRADCHDKSIGIPSGYFEAFVVGPGKQRTDQSGADDVNPGKLIGYKVTRTARYICANQVRGRDLIVNPNWKYQPGTDQQQYKWWGQSAPPEWTTPTADKPPFATTFVTSDSCCCENTKTSITTASPSYTCSHKKKTK